MLLRSLGIDRRFAGWALAWSLAALVAYGLVAAIIPNPVFGRALPPEPFAIAVWLLSAPLMGIIGASYATPAMPIVAGPATSVPLAPAPDIAASERRTGRLGAVASVGAFLAIGCPVCNKVALVLLGTGGTLAIWAPLQPVVGAASLALLGATAVWRLTLRRRGTCIR